MENLSLIVAVGKNNEIGKDNKLLWNLPNDLKYFKEKTLNKTIIMGRKTFDSLPRMLPHRKHIILTNNLEYKVEGALIFYTVDEVLNYIKETKEDFFVIGGSTIYQAFLPYAKTLYITKIHDSKEADTYFPSFNECDYEIEIIGLNKDNNIEYQFNKYTKKN